MALGVEVDHRAVHHVNRSPGEGGLQLGDQSVASALVATAGKLVKTWNAEKTGIDQEFAAERIAHWLSYLPKCEWSPELPERGDAGRLAQGSCLTRPASGTAQEFTAPGRSLDPSNEETSP